MHTHSNAHITALVCDLFHFALTLKKNVWFSFDTNDTYLCVSLTELNGDSTETEKWQLFAIRLYVSILFTALAAVCVRARERKHVLDVDLAERTRWIEIQWMYTVQRASFAVWRNQCSIHWNRSLSMWHSC